MYVYICACLLLHTLYGNVTLLDSSGTFITIHVECMFLYMSVHMRMLVYWSKFLVLLKAFHTGVSQICMHPSCLGYIFNQFC